MGTAAGHQPASGASSVAVDNLLSRPTTFPPGMVCGICMVGLEGRTQRSKPEEEPQQLDVGRRRTFEPSVCFCGRRVDKTDASVVLSLDII